MRALKRNSDGAILEFNEIASRNTRKFTIIEVDCEPATGRFSEVSKPPREPQAAEAPSPAALLEVPSIFGATEEIPKPSLAETIAAIDSVLDEPYAAFLQIRGMNEASFGKEFPNVPINVREKLNPLELEHLVHKSKDIDRLRIEIGNRLGDCSGADLSYIYRKVFRFEGKKPTKRLLANAIATILWRVIAENEE